METRVPGGLVMVDDEVDNVGDGVLMEDLHAE